ncbi:MAG: DUF4339 domain-containing protein [Akkermansiaceae bacterium]
MDNSTTSQWFYSEDGAQKGPVAFSVLQQKFASGELSPTSLVWTNGMAEWVPASSVTEFAAINSNNPYAAPSVDPHLPATSSHSEDEGIPSPPIPLNVRFCIGQGWKHTFANYGTIVLTGLVYVGIMIVWGVISELLGGASESDMIYNPNSGEFDTVGSGPNFVSVLLSITEQILTLFLSMGATKIGLDLLAGRNANIGDLFSQGSKLLNGIAASVLFWIMVIAGLILLIVPGIILAIRFGYYQQAIVERNLGPIEALTYSWRLTQQNGLSLFCLIILNFLVIAGGILALLLGLLIAIPVVWLSSLVAYRYLHGGIDWIKVLS